jgi:hypothetical protein
MKTLISAVLLTLAAAWAAPPLSADVDVEIDFHYFHERLSPHGHWIEVDDYGWCWYPADVHDDWRPYVEGHWVYCEPDGWCWVSDYEWGWAPFHYGRWYHTGHRWVWVPGYEWCGAWVVWRHGGGYCGWAPLSPEVTWEVGIGLRRGDFSYEVDIYEPSWVFCHEERFTSVSLTIVRPVETRVIIHKTVVLGSVTVQNKTTITNRALRVKTIETVAEQPVKRVKLRDERSLGATRVERESNEEVRVFRPKVKRGGEGAPQRVDEVEAERKTLREKHQAERQRGNGDRELEARQKREEQEADQKVRNRLEKRKPPEGRKETPTRREKQGGKRDTPQGREQDRPERDTPEGKPDREPQRENPQGKPNREPQRETPQGKPKREPQSETPQGKPKREPQRETPQGKPKRDPEPEKPQSEPRREPQPEKPQSKPRRDPEPEKPQSKPKRDPEPEKRESKPKRDPRDDKRKKRGR